MWIQINKVRSNTPLYMTLSEGQPDYRKLITEMLSVSTSRKWQRLELLRHLMTNDYYE